MTEQFKKKMFVLIGKSFLFYHIKFLSSSWFTFVLLEAELANDTLLSKSPIRYSDTLQHNKIRKEKKQIIIGAADNWRHAERI